MIWIDYIQEMRKLEEQAAYWNRTTRGKPLPAHINNGLGLYYKIVMELYGM